MIIQDVVSNDINISNNIIVIVTKNVLSRLLIYLIKYLSWIGFRTVNTPRFFTMKESEGIILVKFLKYHVSNYKV